MSLLLRHLTSVAVMTLVLLTGVKAKGVAMSATPIHPTEATGKGAHLDSAVNRELFIKWRAPRFGSANPERVDRPVWEWLVRPKLNAYQATERIRGPSALHTGPGWCFDRFGQSSTKRPEGRVVLIAADLAILLVQVQPNWSTREEAMLAPERTPAEDLALFADCTFVYLNPWLE